MSDIVEEMGGYLGDGSEFAEHYNSSPSNSKSEDTLREQVEKILGVSHVDEPPTQEVAEILSLIEEEKNKAETKIVQKYLDINMRNGHVSRGLLENDLATLNSKDEYSIEDIKTGKVESDIKKLSGIPDHFESKEQK